MAIEELARAASLDADALEVHMILGNLYREKGQVGKAITVHQGLLQRPNLTQARTRVRPALPRARLQARRVRRSRARGLQRSAAARLDQQLRPRQPAEAARRAAPVDRRVRHAPAPVEADRRGQRVEEPGDSGVSRERNRPGSDAPQGLSRSDPAVRGRHRARRPRGARLPEPRRRAGGTGQGPGRRQHLGTADRGRARSRVSRLRSPRVARRAQRHARPLHAPVPAAHRGEPAGLARAARPVAPPRRQRPPARCARPAVRRARAEPARARHPPGHLARARPAALSRRRS